MLDTILQVAIGTALCAAGLATGLLHGAGGVGIASRRVGLIARMAVADVIVLPVAIWLLVRAADLPEGHAIGILLVGMASAGAAGLVVAQIAGADMAVAVVLVAVLELANVVAIPVWSALLLPAGSDIEIGGIVRLVVLLIALPVVVGAALRRLGRWDPAALARWPRAVAGAGLAVVIALILVRDHRALWSAPAEVWLVAAAGTALGIALGALAGWPDTAPRRWSAALVIGVRASAPALAIAASAFPGRVDVRVGVVVFGACSIGLPTLLALSRRAVTRPLPAGAHPARTPP